VFGVAVLGALVYGRLPGGHVRDSADQIGFLAGLHQALWLSGLALLAVAAVSAVLLVVSSRRVSPSAARRVEVPTEHTPSQPARR
jgi:hypothetical protein